MTPANIANTPDDNLVLTIGKPPPGSRCFLCAAPFWAYEQAGALAWCRAEGIRLLDFHDPDDLNAAIADATPGAILQVFTLCIPCLGRAAVERLGRELEDGERKGRRLLIEENIRVDGWTDQGDKPE